jgi:serine/threonine protein kinase
LEQMGKYQLVRRLATGGMAEVYLAKAAGPMGFEKELVVKRILPHLAEDPRFIEMFLAEAKLAARLNHGNVVQIFDFGEQDESYFIAMEYVEGLNLKTLSRRAFQQGTPIAYPLISRMVAMACEGLAYAHDLLDPLSGKPLGFIHRDISTDNILVSMTGSVKVVDFGIAKAANVDLQTQGGVIKGKLSYLPPEYLMGSPINSRADIYALGVVLYELIAGRKPFIAETEDQLVQLIIQAQPADIKALRGDVPPLLLQVLERALHKDRESRYANCRQMQADLERFLFQCGEPIGALQIADLVKRLAAVPDASPGRRHTREPFPAIANAPPASEQATRSLKPVNPDAVTSPHEDTIVTPPPASSIEEDDTELLRLIARPRWHLPVTIVASLLILAGVAVHFSSAEAPSVSAPPEAAKEVAAANPPSAQAPPADAVPSTAPPSPAPVLEAAHPEVASTEAPKAPSPVEEKAQPAAVTKEQPAVAPAAEAVRSGPSKVKVESQLPGRVMINDRFVGTTPWEGQLSPGKKRISVKGKAQQRQFNAEQTVQLRAGEDQTVSFSFQLMRVQVQGQPGGVTVLSLDDESLESEDWVKAYEGRHTLSLANPLTGKTFPAECEVKAAGKACKVVQVPR